MPDNAYEEYPDSQIDDGFLSRENEKILKLTRNEALFIDDSLTMIIEREHGDERLTTVRPLQHTAGLPSPVDLIEKVAIAILHATDPDNLNQEEDKAWAEVTVSDTDLFMLREISHSYIKVGEEPVGYNLKRKIYSLLYQKNYEREKVARNIISQLDPHLLIDDLGNDQVPSQLNDLPNTRQDV